MNLFYKTKMQFNKTKSYQALKQHSQIIKKQTIASLFKDKNRFNDFSIKTEDLLLDYSKQLIAKNTIDLLLSLAKEQDLKANIDNMFKGDNINFTEARKAWHTRLRDVNDKDIKKELNKIKDFSENLRTGKHLGFSGKKITDVVNIGVGGSDLGPNFICSALSHLAYEEPIKVHFVSTMDGEQLTAILNNLNNTTTLFIISSKSFKTDDTMINFALAKKWFYQNGGIEKDFNKHFVAITANRLLAEKEFAERNIFNFWDFVGGRFSLWSAIGLSIAIYLSFDEFMNLLAGARKIDNHFKNARFAENMPVLMALIEIWNINFLKKNAKIILPYSYTLAKLPNYLAQLEMESLGKKTNNNGEFIDYQTGILLFGDVGTNAQHAFYQLLHQGMHNAIMEFILIAKDTGSKKANLMTFLNAAAQSEALAFGNKGNNNHKHHTGNNSSNTLVLNKLSANTLGQLIALYEHKVFVQSALWQINAFDQFGVELGKKMANSLYNGLQNNKLKINNSSTKSLIEIYLKENNNES